MIRYGSDYCSDRESSMPLEHKFGCTRIRTKDMNTLAKFIKTLADVDQYSVLIHNMHQTVNGRRDTFGICISDFHDCEMNEFSVKDYLPQDIALAFLHQAGFTVEFDKDSLKVINWFYRVLKSMNDNIKKTKKPNSSSNSVVLGTHGNIRSRFLITNQNSFLPAPLKIEEKNNYNQNQQFINFLNLFNDIYKKEPRIKDYRYLYSQIKEHDNNCPKISDENLIESYESWIDSHFFEYEALIYTILNDKNLKYTS
ncbi:hypothetical protein M9Y10_004630 [Tritrichomonas musculus]|uniref:Uncharacterized protein n=1 Tax=Tritrichomonas musculus TaxID=1915356 RepID=A0ABR2JL01_9EUKA